MSSVTRELLNILFVCSGNTCRSPLAEAIATRMFAVAGRTDLIAASAGTQAWDGSSASDGSILVGMERGLDLSGHRSRLLTTEIVGASDLILVMSEQHLERVKELEPGADAYLLGGYASRTSAGRTIADPFGGDLDAYRETADDLERELSGLLDRIPAP